MIKYKMSFYFDFGGACIWDDGFKGGAIMNIRRLPISTELVGELENLMYEYSGYLDWDYPPNPSPWSKEEKIDFLRRSTIVYEKLRNELGSEYEIINKVRELSLNNLA